MNFSTKAVACLAALTIRTVAGAGQKNDNAASAGIDIECQNIDWIKLTPTEKSFVGLNLERAFNKIENVVQLTDVEWDESPAPSSTQEVSLLDYMSSLLWTGGESGHFHARVENDEGGRRLFCRFCIDDDSRLLSEEDEATNLRGVTNNYDFIYEWETQLEYHLHEGPYSSLSDAHDCKIKVHDANDNLQNGV